MKGRSIRLKNRIKNIEGTSSEEAPEYFGTKGALSFRIENIMCDILFNSKTVNALENESIHRAVKVLQIKCFILSFFLSFKKVTFY